MLDGERERAREESSKNKRKAKQNEGTNEINLIARALLCSNI